VALSARIKLNKSTSDAGASSIIMGCQTCDDLIATYKRSVRNHTTFLLNVSGAPTHKSPLVSKQATRLARKCREANDALMSHWRQDHTELAQKAGLMGLPA